jgi:hypothetical protein
VRTFELMCFPIHNRKGLRTLGPRQWHVKEIFAATVLALTLGDAALGTTTFNARSQTSMSTWSTVEATWL